MSIFTWTAPLFKLWGKRWSLDDFQWMAGWLRPYVPEGGLLADVGGGTGELGTGLAAELAARAVIVDPTPQMLRRVDANPWVSVRLAQAEALPFPDGWFDAIVCSDAFHHFRDQSAAAREFARVVRPGGGVVVLELDPTGRDRFWVFLERLAGEPVGFRTPEELQSFLGASGIHGETTRQHGSTYSYVGTVGHEPVAGAPA